MTASDVVVEGLIDWGVEVIFGLPGDGINGFMEALRKAKDRLKYVHMRHEEAVAMAACEQALLKKMGLDAELLDSGCCGMAGLFGYAEHHRDISGKMRRACFAAARAGSLERHVDHLQRL